MRMGSRVLWLLAAPGMVASLCCLAASAQAAPLSVQNGDLEQLTAGEPDCFSQKGWGDSSVSWELTTAAHSGTVAQSVTVSATQAAIASC